MTTNEMETNKDSYSIVIKIILDNMDDHVREAKLESVPLLPSDING